MITESVKNLFSFIDFLHGKTEYFLSKQNLVENVLELLSKRNSLKPDQNFKDRIEHKKVQAELEKEFDILKEETTNIIISKIEELNIADISTPITNIISRGDLFELQRNFCENDLEEIFEARKKYTEFRTKTNSDYFIVPFFGDLDRELKEFFDYFKETNESEFEAFEIKDVQVEKQNINESEIRQENKVNEIDDLLEYFGSTGEVVRPKIEFYNDGTHKVVGWSIGKTIDELYKEKVEQINKEVEQFEVKCFNKGTDVESLKLLAQQLRDTVYLYRHRNNVFENNPKQQKDIEEYLKSAADRLERLLNDVVLPKIEFRNSKTLKLEKPELSDSLKKEEAPDLPETIISFNGSETITKLHNELKGYFENNGEELLKALKGEKLKELLLFPHNQNKFVEVFKRAKYNNFILSTPTEIRDWICSSFTYRKKKGNIITVENFNKNTVWDTLTKDKGEPPSKERICKCDWLPYKSYAQRQRETEKEKQ